MPDEKDIERIEEMLTELGETELELGEMPGEAYTGAPKEEEAAEAPVPPETEVAPEPPEKGDFQELLKDIEIGLTEEQELEKQMAAPPQEAPIPEEEIALPEAELPPAGEEVPTVEEGISEPGLELPEVGEEEVLMSLEELLGEEAAAPEEEEAVEMEAAAVSEAPAHGPPAEEPEMAGALDEEALDLPVDFDLEDLLVQEGPPGAAGREEEAEKEVAPELTPAPAEEAQPPGIEEAEGPPEEVIEEEAIIPLPEEMVAAAEEPSIDLEGLAFEEIAEPAEELPAEGMIEEPELEEGEIPAEIEEGLEAILAPEEMGPGEQAVFEEPQIPPEELEVSFEEQELPAEEREVPVEEMEFLAEEKEALVKEAPSEAPGGVDIEGLSLEDLEAIGLKGDEAEEVPSELPPLEEIGEEELAAGEEREAPEVLGVELVEEPGPVEMERFEEAAGPEPPEVPEIEEEKAAAMGGVVMELSDDDIGQIKTKLSTLNPILAATIQGIIVRGTLPAESMNGILELLIMDAPEEEITEYVERVTGRKIAPPRVRPAVPVAVRKPGVFGALAENIGPFLRAATLFGVIAVILGALFMVFFFNPLRARRYYQEALEQVDRRDYASARYSMERAQEFQNRTPQFFQGVRQYDSLGWQFMLAGQQSLARAMFEEGIRREIDKGKNIGNLRIFMRLAILHNLDGEYGEAEDLYVWVLKDLDEEHQSYPAIIEQTREFRKYRENAEKLRRFRGNTEEFEDFRTQIGFEVAKLLSERVSLNGAARYDFRMLRGENLVAQVTEAGTHDERMDGLAKAYVQYMQAARERKNDAPPLFKMMQIEIQRDNRQEVDRIAGEVQRRFPKAVDEEVQTELSRYYIGKDYLTSVRELLLRVLHKKNITYPFPPAYYAYAEYYRAVGNSSLQEDYLQAAINAEQNRILPSVWNFRDRTLVSWTDYGAKKIPFVKTGRQGASESQNQLRVETGFEKRELLFPWDSRDRTLLSLAYNDIGEIYAGRSTYEDAAQAIGYFTKSIEENPGNARALFNLAQMYFYRVKDYKSAKKYYVTFERMQHNGFTYGDLVNDLNYNLGFILYSERKFNEALKKWSDLSVVMPDNPHVSSALGNTFLHLGSYRAALGEFLMLSEVYDHLVEGLGEIKPWRDYHKRILLESAAVHNNLGVAYYKLAEETADENQKREYEKKALLALYKAGELADLMGGERGAIQYNIQKIIHPNVARGDMAINDELSTDYRFAVQ